MAPQHTPTKMFFAHRVAPVGMTSVGWFPLPSGRLPFGRMMHFIGTAATLVVAGFGVSLDTPIVAMGTCAAMLLFGLPHGAFDLALIRQAHADHRTLGVVMLYLGCAAAMFAIWRVAPPIALIIFLGLSIVHFAEDWADSLPPFFAYGTSTALLTAPVILHDKMLTELFTLLAGDASSPLIAAVALLVAPVSLATASVAMIALWSDGYRSQALATAFALSAMIFLPPLVGFALFFCLMHSPAQFAAAQHTLRWRRPAQWGPVIVPLTCAALGIAALIFAMLTNATIIGAMVGTAFITLSILTLPHMAVPWIVARL